MRRQPHRAKKSIHSPDSDHLALVPSEQHQGAPRRPLTCRRHQRAEPHARALNLQIHDREAAHGHQLLQLFSQLQGKGQNERTLQGGHLCLFVHSAQTQEAPGGEFPFIRDFL